MVRAAQGVPGRLAPGPPPATGSAPRPETPWFPGCWPPPAPPRVLVSYRDNYQRLAQVKATWDPGNLFHVNQNIQPAMP